MNGVRTHNYSGDSTVERVPYDHDHDGPLFLGSRTTFVKLLRAFWSNVFEI